MTITDILNLPDDSWIDDLNAYVSNVRPGQGKAPARATLTDQAGTTITACFFGHQLAPFTARWIAIQGKGIKKNSYNGEAQIVVGDKATLQVVGGGQPAAQAQQPAPQPPPRQTTFPGAGAPAPMGPPPGQDFGKHLRKMQLGMAHAVVAAREVGQKLQTETGYGLDAVHEQAVATSFFIEMNRKGMLDMKLPGLGAAAEPQAPPPPPPPPPNTHWTPDDSDEVPF